LLNGLSLLLDILILCCQATAEANNLAAVAKSKDLYVTEMEKVISRHTIMLYYQLVFINGIFQIVLI